MKFFLFQAEFKFHMLKLGEWLIIIDTVLGSELVPTAESVRMEYLGQFWKSSKIQALTL